MDKQEFLRQLRMELREYPDEEITKSVGYYSEMIEDRIEDGMTEQEAVASAGNIAGIVEQIKREMPITAPVKYTGKKKRKEKRMPAWAILLLVIGSPLWIGIVVLLFGLLLVAYALVWIADILLWSMVLITGAGVLCGIPGLFVSLSKGMAGSAFIYLGAALACAGIGIFLYAASLAATRGILHGTKWFFVRLKQSFTGSERKEEKAA